LTMSPPKTAPFSFSTFFLHEGISFVHSYIPDTWLSDSECCLGSRHSPASLFPMVQCSLSPDRQAQRDSGGLQSQAPSTAAVALPRRARADCARTQTWPPRENEGTSGQAPLSTPSASPWTGRRLFIPKGSSVAVASTAHHLPLSALHFFHERKTLSSE
jgi:hypothetical protein